MCTTCIQQVDNCPFCRASFSSSAEETKVIAVNWSRVSVVLKITLLITPSCLAICLIPFVMSRSKEVIDASAKTIVYLLLLLFIVADVMDGLELRGGRNTSRLDVPYALKSNIALVSHIALWGCLEYFLHNTKNLWWIALACVVVFLILTWVMYIIKIYVSR
jgi:hypothetical protein